MALLKQHVQAVPAATVDDETIARWIVELDADKFSVRENAQKALAKTGVAAVALLRKALAASRDYSTARESLQRAAQLDPQDPSPHYQLARVLQNLGETAAAQQALARFQELNKVRQQTGGMASGRTPQ